ncbi:DUF1295 domain-containing protein [bacterium]|nr:DUF1295 domain-containing protein [bacterium]
MLATVLKSLGVWNLWIPMTVTLFVLYGGKVLVGYKRGTPVDDEEYFQYYANVVLPGSWLVIISLLLISILVPVKITVWFWIGLALLIIGNGFVIGSLWQFAHASERALIRTGLFRITRNPMYFGFNLSLLGMIGMIGFHISLFSVMFFSMSIVWFFVAHSLIHSEEVFLAMRHQDFYDRYRSRVARYLSLSSFFNERNA